MKKLIAALIAAGLMLLTGLAADADAAKKKKKSESGLSEGEKAALRKKFTPVCIKKYAQGGSGTIIRVEVLSDGSVYCWYRI